MTAAVVVTGRARAHYDRVDTWWRDNRPKSPGLFAREFRRLIALLRDAPGIGQRYQCEGETAVRRYFLRRTGHHVYYLYESDLVTILGIWNAASDREPDFI